MDILANLGNWILVALSQLLYFLESCCYALLDLAQLMFRLLAGLDTGSQGAVGGDIFYQIIRRTFFTDNETSYSVIAVAFWSLLILSCILLFVTTIAAIIKSEVASKDGKFDNSKGKIIADSIKAVLYFVIVPVACYFGLWFGNVVLFAIDSATAPQTTSIVSLKDDVTSELDPGDSGSYNYYIFWGTKTSSTYTSVSGMVNKLCLFQANRIRNDDAFYEMIVKNEPIATTPEENDPIDPDGNVEEGETGENVTDTPTETPPTIVDGTYNFGIILGEKEEAATIVDDLFMFNAKLKTPQTLNYYDYTSAYGDASGSTVEYFDRSNIALVSYFYDLTGYNHILAILFIFTGGKILLTMSFAVMHRIIMLLAMIFAEPITLSFMPLDKGNAFGEWRKSFISYVISLYVLVLAVNVFYIITPVFQTLTFFGDSLDYLSWADMVVQAAFIVAALSAIQSLETMFSNMLGGKSIMETGSKMTEKAFDAAKTVGNVAVGVAGIGLGAAGAAAHLGAAGVKTGMAYTSAFKAGLAKSNMADNKEKASKTDGQIRKDIIKNNEASAHKDYNKDIEDAYGKYASAHKNGEALSQSDWLKTDEGKKVEEANRAKFGGLSEDEYVQQENTRMDEMLTSGVATSDKDKEALSAYQSQIEERDEAREKYNIAQEKYNKNKEKGTARIKRAKNSFKLSSKSFGNMVRGVGGLAGGKKK